MSQSPTDIRLYTDEDVSGRLATALARNGFDVLSCHQAGNSGFGHPDSWQLGFAVDQERAILTHDVGDYSVLAARWAIEGRTHFGIVLIHRAPTPALIPRVSAFLSQTRVAELYNVMRWVP